MGRAARPSSVSNRTSTVTVAFCSSEAGLVDARLLAGRQFRDDAAAWAQQDASAPDVALIGDSFEDVFQLRARTSKWAELVVDPAQQHRRALQDDDHAFLSAAGSIFWRAVSLKHSPPLDVRLLEGVRRHARRLRAIRIRNRRWGEPGRSPPDRGRETGRRDEFSEHWCRRNWRRLLRGRSRRLPGSPTLGLDGTGPNRLHLGIGAARWRSVVHLCTPVALARAKSRFERKCSDFCHCRRSRHCSVIIAAPVVHIYVVGCIISHASRPIL